MDFSRNFWTLANGSTADAPLSLTYSSVVSRDSVSIAFLVAELNDLDVMACDVGNVYLNATCREKIWFVACLDHGKRKGKVMVIVRSLYVIKSSGSSWRAIFAERLSEMNFVPTQADPDEYQWRAQMANGDEYYELLLVYVDDVLTCSHAPQAIMDNLALT